MPNHVTTNLTITGPITDVRAFVAAVDKSKEKDGNEFDFNGIVPMPEELKNTTSPSNADEKTMDVLIAKYGAHDWYTWAIKNWGTKWGAYNSMGWDVGETGDLGHATITYDTAWSPATEFFTSASKKFPTLNFELEYADEGGAFVCTAQCKDGIYHEFDYDWNSAAGIDVREHLGMYYPEDEEDEDDE